MSDAIRLFKHSHYQGPSVWWAGPSSTKGTPRIKGFTQQSLKSAGLYQEITSFKFEEVQPDRRVTTIFLSEDNFEGDFVAFLGEKPGHDVPNLGAYNFNDKTASILMVRHSATEHLPLRVGAAVRSQATSVIDEELKQAIQSRGIGISRRGELVFTWEMRPQFAQYQMLVQIDIPLTVEISLWFDYDVSISYFIYPYLDNQHRLRAEVAYVKGWVEGGVLSGSIASQMKTGAASQTVIGTLETEINDALENLDYRAWDSFYLMPGETPLYGWKDYSGNTRDEVTLVLVPQ